MSIKDKAHRLFDYISQVYSIDLPAIRNISQYKAEFWWQADLVCSSQCKIKEFETEEISSDTEDLSEPLNGEAWLSVTKRQYDQPPDLPSVLTDWVNLSFNPTKIPSPKPSLSKIVSFDDDKDRVSAFRKYKVAWEDWKESKVGKVPDIPEILNGWLLTSQPDDEIPAPVSERKFEERFEDNPVRVEALKSYISGAWKLWSERVLPLFKANMLYDQLFSLHQRLSIEGDRIEIIWGHVLLAWEYSLENIVYHPLILTPMNLNFDPMRRHIFLTPSQTTPTKIDFDCLLNLEYSLKDELIKFVHKINNSDMPPEVWNHNQMRGLASTITGYLSKESAEKTNLYSNEIISRPPIPKYPTIYNAPVIFVRERMRRLWVDDAKKVAEAIYNGADIPPFIKSFVADPHSLELPNPEDYSDSDIALDEDGGELMLPLEYNAQQEEVVRKLRNHFGALVQGPPGTGKSHTIANIVSSLLAKGKRVLVTSQTENALRVLRDYIPEEIRSLCVSQLGNDIEAKRQLNEAVDAIGKHLSERNSSIVEQRIKDLRKELRSLREEQARLRNHIKDWVDLDASTLKINNETISALQAAKECSENAQDHSWFPDKIPYHTEPQLNEHELIELCSLVKEISSEDRKSCSQYLPLPDYILEADIVSGKISRWKSLSAISAEAESLRCNWGEQLSISQPAEIEDAVRQLEDALLSLRDFKNNWQLKILELTILEEVQDSYWQNFLKKCVSYRESAWQAYQVFHGYEIEISQDLPADMDIDAALDELNKRTPTNLIGKVFLSKSAKLMYKLVRVDGHPLNTSERLNAVKAYFTYHKFLRKIKTLWDQSIQAVDGPELSVAGSMPLAVIDEAIKDIRCPLDWKGRYFECIKNTLTSLSCRHQELYKQDILESSLKMLYCQLAEIEKRAIENSLSKYSQFLKSEASKDDAHIIWSQLADSVIARDKDRYEEFYIEFTRLLKVKKIVERLEELSSKLRAVVPLWYASLEKKALKLGADALEKDWAIAWRWKRLDEWLKFLHNRESVDSLQNKLERARKKEREFIVQLVKERTWQRQIANVKDHHYIALTAWENAMRRYGKTGGKYGYRWLAAAAKAMVDAVNAVPAWIMPLHRVVQSFPCESCVFDVVIIDEASQCDLRALPVLFRAKKVLVVGDPEQISPSNVGIDREKVFALIQQFLFDISHKEIFYIDNSLYDITKSIPRMDRTLLTEHFRCVLQIIEFNNYLCPSYAGRLEPLRQPHPQEILNPSIVTIWVENGFKNKDEINEPEAEALVEMIVKCCRDERYASGGKNNRKRTMGVISLLGEKQAKYISDLIAQYIDETEREERRIICGDAYAFQGDERDVMFLSMVVATNAPFAALVKDSDRQRFNVATSRARDQVFLFHSVRLDDIKNSECMRYKLLSWYLNPPLAEMETGIEMLKQKADSPFEIEVGERIIKKGYKVIPQFRPFPRDFNYRIDLVVQGEYNRVAVECDGDKAHGPEKWEYDQRREAQLRRAGWKFWRISGSTFYRNKDKAVESLWQFLDDEGIKPFANTQKDSENKQTEKLPYSLGAEKKTSQDINNKIAENSSDKYKEIKTHTAHQSPNSSSQSLSNKLPSEQQRFLFAKDKIPPLSNNPNVWFDIADWVKESMAINTYWREFAKEIGNALLYRENISGKQKRDMNKCWEMAFKKGFRPRSL